MKFLNYVMFGIGFAFCGCAHSRTGDVGTDEAVRFDRKLVKDAVVYDPGTESGAVVPEISAPSLRATWVPERIEGNRLIEAHREWILDGDVALLGIPKRKEAKR